MDKQKLQELDQELSTLLAKYNCTLKIQQNIIVVPNKMEENTPVVEETEAVEETPAEEVA